jgi:DNA primase
MHQAGESNTVAPLGTAFTEDQCLKLGRYAKNCNLLFDSDHAGKEATKKAIYILEKMSIKSRVIQIDGKDPADILQNSSIDLLKKIHKKGINSFTYIIEEAKKQFDYKTPEGKLSIFNEVWPYLEIIQSDIKLSSSIKTLAEEIDVDEKIIVSEMRKMQNRSTSSDRHERISAQRVEKSLELYIMLVVVNNREFFIDVRRHIRLDDLEDVRAKEIYTALEESLREGETSFENLLNRIEQDEIKTLIRENYGSEEYMIRVESLIADLLKRYGLRKLERQRKSIENRIKMLEKSGDLDIKGMQDLLYEKKFIDEEIGKIRNL